MNMQLIQNIIDTMAWTTYVKNNRDLISNGVIAITVFDNVLDQENWPVDCIFMKSGIVIKQVPVYNNTMCAYRLPNMVGWSTVRLYQWLKENDGNESHHPCVENGLTVIGEEV